MTNEGKVSDSQTAKACEITELKKRDASPLRKHAALGLLNCCSIHLTGSPNPHHTPALHTSAFCLEVKPVLQLKILILISSFYVPRSAS